MISPSCPALQRTPVNGIELAWDSHGDEAGETILLIAGLGTQMVRWPLAFCQDLAARGFRVIRFDNRDVGASTHLVEAGVPDLAALMAGHPLALPYSLHDMATDALGLLDSLGIQQAHLVGRSMGGVIAQVLASEHPRRVRSLTSIMASSGNPALPPPAPQVMALLTAPAADPATDLEGHVTQRLALARRIAGTVQAFDAQAQRALVLEELRRGWNPAGFMRQLAALACAGDRRARLASIQAPTLVVHGSEDPLIPAACGEDTARSIPGAEWLLIPGMGHDLPPACQPSVLAAIERTARRC